MSGDNAMKSPFKTLVMTVTVLTQATAGVWAQEAGPLQCPFERLLVEVAIRQDPHLPSHDWQRIADDRAAIAAEPDRYLERFRREVVPQPFEPELGPPADWRHQVARTLIAINLLELLGRDRAEPILRESFIQWRTWFQEIPHRAEQLERDQVAGGGNEGNENEALIGLGQLHSATGGILSRLVMVAKRLDSPILVDPLLQFYESGLNDRQSGWPAYPLLFAHERPDVIPRLSAIMEHPQTDRMVKHQIQRALDGYAKSLVDAHPADPPLAEVPARPETPRLTEEPRPR
jgi:hypothetical protein